MSCSDCGRTLAPEDGTRCWPCECELVAFIRDYEADRRELIWGDAREHELTGIQTMIADVERFPVWRSWP